MQRVKLINTYVILYPPPFQVTTCNPPQLSHGIVGRPFPVPVAGGGLDSVCFELREICLLEDDESFGNCCCCCGSCVGGGLVLYLAVNIDYTH